MGTPEFSVPCLRTLIENGHDVCAVVTQPDKPQGRGHKLTPPPVKVLAEENKIEVFQPESLKDFAFKPQLERLLPEMIVVVAYGKILPEYILDFPKYGCINIHASLLPKYRGAGPIQWAVVNGEEKTGITSMLMEKGLDTGDMLVKKETPIYQYETAGELHDRLMTMGGEVLLETIKKIQKGEISPQKQNDKDSTYAPMISKDTGLIDWKRNAKEILGLIHGMNPWPVAHTLYKGETLKIYNAKLLEKGKGTPGEITKVSKEGMEILCGDGMKILAYKVQFKGSKCMLVKEYLNGHTISEGEVLG